MKKVAGKEVGKLFAMKVLKKVKMIVGTSITS